MARKDVAILVSAAGWIGGFVDQLIRALRERGVTDEQIHQLVTESGEMPVGKIADLLASLMLAAKNLFHLMVDYGRSIEGAVAAGKYDYANPNITATNFPTKRAGKVKLAVELVHFGRNIDSDEAIAELDKMGLRPAGLHELLALGEQHPELQRQFPIVALEQVWQRPDGYRNVPVLYESDRGRELLLLAFALGWLDDYRFAAARK